MKLDGLAFVIKEDDTVRKQSKRKKMTPGEYRKAVKKWAEDQEKEKICKLRR
jgi:hypothetical protein